MPLVYRVAGVNALVLVAAVAVTLVVLAPRKLSSFALDEAAVLTGALVLVALVNLLVLRRIVRPLETLTALARRVDLTRPGARMPGATASSEAGELALTFNDMLSRLETERREATGRVLEAQESERLRIALELHDQVGQELTAVLLGLARVRGMLDESLRARRGGHPGGGACQPGGCAADRARAPPRGPGRPRAGQRAGGAVRALLPANGDRGDPAPRRASARARATRRSSSSTASPRRRLTNVARHSGADHAELRLSARNGGLVVTVSDDGRGISAGGEPGTGIRGMRERAALIGATLEVGANDDGRGCAVTLVVEGAPAEAPP